MLEFLLALHSDFIAVTALGLTPALRPSPFSSMSTVLLQLIVGTAEMVVGILALTFYALNVDASGVTRSPGTLLQIILLAFTFGILSFAVACLGVVPVLSGRTNLSQTDNREYQNYSPQTTTREYVTQRRQTFTEQAWTGLACPDCGRTVSYDDSFCDLCGAQFKQLPQASVDAQTEILVKA